MSGFALRVHVGNLSYSTIDQSLRDFFTVFGEVVDSIVMRDRDTERSRGFGFVTFGNQKAMNDAIEGGNGQQLDGRIITVRAAAK